MLPGLARQRDLAVPAVAEGALDEDGKFDARTGDTVAYLAETLAEDGDEIAGGSTLGVEAEPGEVAVDADVAVLAENLRNGEVLVAREDGDDVVEVRFHGTLVVDAEEMSDGTSSPRAYKGTEWTTPVSECPFSEAFMARSGLYSRR